MYYNRSIKTGKNKFTKNKQKKNLFKVETPRTQLIKYKVLKSTYYHKGISKKYLLLESNSDLYIFINIYLLKRIIYFSFKEVYNLR